MNIDSFCPTSEDKSAEILPLLSSNKGTVLNCHMFLNVTIQDRPRFCKQTEKFTSTLSFYNMIIN